MAERYQVKYRGMRYPGDKRKNKHGEWGVWDTKKGQWVVNTEFREEMTAARMCLSLNYEYRDQSNG